MKILLFTENYYKGGLDTFIISLINNWPDQKDSITLICNYNHPGIETYELQIKRDVMLIKYNLFNNYDLIKKLDDIYPTKYFSKIVGFIFKYPFFIKNIFALRNVLIQNKPDRLMIINGGYPGGDFCRAATILWGLSGRNRTSIHNFHNIAIQPRRILFLIEYFIDRLIEKYSNNIVSVSKHSAESILTRLGFQSSKKICYIYNGIEHTQRSKKVNLNSELRIDNNSSICLMLGTFEPRKGHDFAIKAFRKVVDLFPSAHLLCCGYGYPLEIENVRGLVRRFKLQENVHLWGFREDKDNLLWQSDLLLIASQAFESFGYTAIEAMACKVPVVSTNIGGLPEVVKNGEGGYCLEYYDVENYASKIIELLQNEDLRIEQGRKGYFRYKKLFTAKRMAEEYYRLIKE